MSDKKKTKVIIIEGPDRVGKDTLINKLSTEFTDTKVIHACAPTIKDSDKNDNKLFESRKVLTIKELFKFYNDGIIHDTVSDYLHGKLDAIIHNRSVYGEYVYGTKYRGMNKDDIAKLIYKLEMGSLRTYIPGSELYFILLTTNNVDLLNNNDDGNSFSKSKDDIQDELDLFKEIHNLSGIKKKKIIYVNNEDQFKSKDDIYNDVLNFINS